LIGKAWHDAVARELGSAPLAPFPPFPPATNGAEMPKQKTKRAAMKRFKQTGSGKLRRWHANHSHILTKKTRKRKNRLKKGDLVSSADFPRVNRLLQA
jgi:large subunit ribosomal protein L35